MADVLVSVYIANFNYGRYIRQSIDSALAQTFKSFELIIIDDGSTDDSRAIIEEYRGDPRVRIIHQENRGLIATANLGVRAARGRYVMRLDADDWLDPNALLVMVHALEADPEVALVFPDYFFVDAEGQVTGQERRHDFQQVTLHDQPAHGACSLARREYLLDVGPYNADISCQDGVDLWLKIIDRYPVKNISLPLFYYRRHGENLTEQDERILRQRADIFRLHAARSARPTLDVVAVVPVRGASVDPRDMSLTALGDRALIDWTLDAALEVPTISEVIVSSPDDEVLSHVSERYDQAVTVVRRDRDLAEENVQFAAAVDHAVARRRQGESTEAVLELTVEYPFHDAVYLQKAVNAMRIFPVEWVISVLPEDDLLLAHDGTSLRPVGGQRRSSGLRLEREYLFRFAGGILLRRLDAPRQIEAATVGHIVVSRRAAFRVRDALDLEGASQMVIE